jgi:hypothetical protein
MEFLPFAKVRNAGHPLPGNRGGVPQRSIALCQTRSLAQVDLRKRSETSAEANRPDDQAAHLGNCIQAEPMPPSRSQARRFVQPRFSEPSLTNPEAKRYLSAGSAVAHPGF